MNADQPHVVVPVEPCDRKRQVLRIHADRYAAGLSAEDGDWVDAPTCLMDARAPHLARCLGCLGDGTRAVLDQAERVSLHEVMDCTGDAPVVERFWMGGQS